MLVKSVNDPVRIAERIRNMRLRVETREKGKEIE
jgi:hypothetical protein